jgi:hypothetical protein
VITYIRRIVKTPSDSALSDNLIIDYINRFWLMDVDARAQLYDFRTKYTFQTIPGVADYNMPMYSVQTEPGAQKIAPFPVYQGFFGPAYVDGIEIPFYNQRDPFWKIWPNYIQPLQDVVTGDGVTTTFQLNLPYFPAIPAHIDITGIIAQYNVSTSIQDPIFSNTLNLNAAGNWVVPTTSVTPGVTITYTDVDGNNVVFIDSGQFLTGNTGGQLYGLLVQQNYTYPNGLSPLNGGYSTTVNTVNYNTGVVNITFPNAPPAGTPIQAECYYYQSGIPRAVLFFNNTMTIRPPPDTQYTFDINGYLTPAAFLSSSQAIQFGYMCEYIARGAAQKILSDTGDWEQYDRYEPLFLKQELLVWKRSQRQITATRTGTIFSDLQGPQSNLTNLGQGAT